MSARRIAAIRVLVLVFVFMVTAGIIALRSRWIQPQEPYANAARSLPALEALAQEHVTFLRVQDWCRAYSDDRESRTSELAGTCTLHLGCPAITAGCGDFRLFDDAAEKRFAELRGKTENLPYSVHWIRIEYGSDGAVRKAELAIDATNPWRRDALVYEPGYQLPGDLPGEATHRRIDANWYCRREDWN